MMLIRSCFCVPQKPVDYASPISLYKQIEELLQVYWLIKQETQIITILLKVGSTW